MRHLETTNKLDFETAQYPNFFEGEEWESYKVGTVKGLWNCDEKNYNILSFLNKEPGNGNLNDVFEWFEFSAKRDSKNIKILSCFNQNFYYHLIKKRGFKLIHGENFNLIKVFDIK